ncbi:hypothetical protein HN510_03130 [Candidatus Woesearchaeota archaeon]|jgi:hypothetical protein|nr:hypothetical protein [Candidatus Woesearchaeota archaeon]
MIINVDWETFHSRYFLEGTVFVQEHSSYFEFLRCDGVLIIRSVYEKHEDSEQNIAFIERYMTDKKNIVKVLNFDNEEAPEPIVEEEKEFKEVIE